MGQLVCRVILVINKKINIINISIRTEFIRSWLELRSLLRSNRQRSKQIYNIQQDHVTGGHNQETK